MRRNVKMRRLWRLVPWPALLLAGACGGGDKGPTGPGNGGGDEPGAYQLVSIGQIGLPADVAPEDCTLTRFYSGRLDVSDGGSWEIRLEVHHGGEDWGYIDHGELVEDPGVVWFASQISGSVYQGTVDGSAVRIMYDWCYDGTPDVHLVFDR